jgi:mannose/cellobiose epimerase-like protein (N-acyl-D-glucosamine 2-epimerase family)
VFGRVRGGFHEAISLDGRPLARPHRARLIARQAGSYCEAGPARLARSLARGAASRARLFPQTFHHRKRDGCVRSRSGRHGQRSAFDLYNQAFALLAYAGGHCTFGEANGWRRQAVALRRGSSNRMPIRSGFVEDRAEGLPQRSDPHMHLLEAALAWIAVDDDPVWRRMVDGSAALCLEKFIGSGEKRR